MIESVTLAFAVGKRARAERLALGQTLDAMATCMRQIGFKWTTSRVVDLETGKIAPTIGNLLAVCAALSFLRISAGEDWKPVGILDLLPIDGDVEVAKGVSVSAARLRDAFQGTDVLVSVDVQQQHELQAAAITETIRHAERLAGPTYTQRRAMELEGAITLAERRASITLGISVLELIVASQALWGKNLTEERDLRSSPGDSAQRRGRVTRALLDEVAEYISGVDGIAAQVKR